MVLKNNVYPTSRWSFQIWSQHQSSCHPHRLAGDVAVYSPLLWRPWHAGSSRELRRGGHHCHLLWGEKSQGGRGFCEDRKGKEGCSSVLVAPACLVASAPRGIVTCLLSWWCQPIEELEAEMLNGQKLQGPLTAKEVYEALTKGEGNTDEWVVVELEYFVKARTQDICLIMRGKWLQLIDDGFIYKIVNVLKWCWLKLTLSIQVFWYYWMR